VLRGVLARKNIADGYLAQGSIVEWLGTEEVTARVRQDIEHRSAPAKEAGIKAQ